MYSPTIVGAWVEKTNTPGLIIDGGRSDGNNSAVSYNNPRGFGLKRMLTLTGFGVLGFVVRRQKKRATVAAV